MAATTSLSLYSKKESCFDSSSESYDFPLKNTVVAQACMKLYTPFYKRKYIKKLPWSVISKKIDDTFYTQPLLTTKRRESFYVKVTKPPKQQTMLQNKENCSSKKPTDYWQNTLPLPAPPAPSKSCVCWKPFHFFIII